LVSIVSRCLRKDPGERFQSVHELAAALAPLAPAASASSLRAIARFEPRTALQGAPGVTATTAPGSLAPASSPSRLGASPSCAALQRSPAWAGAGVVLG